jgi:TonB family protein
MSNHRFSAEPSGSEMIEVSAIITFVFLVAVFSLSKTFNFDFTVEPEPVKDVIIERAPDLIRSLPISRPTIIIISTDIETENEPITDDELINLAFTDFEKEPLPPIDYRGTETKPDEEIPYVSVEVKPFLSTSERAKLAKAITDNYPRLAKLTGTSGSVKLTFVCTPEGHASSITISSEEPTGLGFGEAAVAALKTVRFSPGYQNDKAVSVRMTQPVLFTSKK